MAKSFAAKTWNHRVGTIIFGVTLIISIMYWTGDLQKMFGFSPKYRSTLIACSVVGAISGLFSTLREKWWLGILAGAIGGAGAFAGFDLYVSLFERTSVFKIEAALVCITGALPGLAVYLLITVLLTKPKEEIE